MTTFHPATEASPGRGADADRLVAGTPTRPAGIRSATAPAQHAAPLAPTATAGVDVIAIETTSAGNRSYIVTDGRLAVVVDPPRDIGRVIGTADRHRVRIALVLETHIHNDYVSGGLALARATGANYALAAAEEVDFAGERQGLEDGDVLLVGDLRVEAVHTPGHTPHHLSYVFSSSAGALAGLPAAVCTGGSLLAGGAGRTDLIDPSAATLWAGAQWRSLRRLGAALPDDTTVHSTHGFGSFCSAAAPTAGAGSVRMGDERLHNPAFVLDEAAYATDLVAGFVAHPSYYAHMGALNRAGAVAAEALPELRTLLPAEVHQRLHAGQWMVDIRRRRDFAAGHVPGTVSAELNDGFATYLAWTLPWGEAFGLLGPSPDDLERARLHLARIGADSPSGAAAAEGGPGCYPVRTFADLAVARPGVVLDVRRPDEWAAGHLAGARHVPLYELVSRVGELPLGPPIWVHCAAGFRASIAASLVARSGRRVALVDDDWSNAPAELRTTA